MLRWLGKVYARRIVNVNVNIVLAGALALPPTLLAVWVAHHLGVPAGWRISVITFVTDITADVAVYFVLHWLANHWPALHVLRGDDEPREPRPHLSFFRDATLVQVERAALSPLLYFLLLGTQYVLTHRGMHPVPATAIAFGLAIGTTRTLHTIWMYKQERKARLVFKRLARKARAEQRSRTASAAENPNPQLHRTEQANGFGFDHAPAEDGGTSASDGRP